MDSQYSKTPNEPVDILLTDNGRILEVGTDSPKISFIPIKLEHRQSADFILQALKDKNWLNYLTTF